MRVTSPSGEYGRNKHIPIEADMLCAPPNFKVYVSQAYKKMKCGGTGELIIEHTPTGDALHVNRNEIEEFIKKVNAFKEKKTN